MALLHSNKKIFWGRIIIYEKTTHFFFFCYQFGFQKSVRALKLLCSTCTHTRTQVTAYRQSGIFHNFIYYFQCILPFILQLLPSYLERLHYSLRFMRSYLTAQNRILTGDLHSVYCYMRNENYPKETRIFSTFSFSCLTAQTHLMVHIYDSPSFRLSLSLHIRVSMSEFCHRSNKYFA